MKQSPLSFLSRLTGLFTFLALMGFSISSCSRSGADEIDPNPTTGLRNVNLYLTDAPADFKNVFVDIQKIEVKVDLDRTHEFDDSYGDGDEDQDDNEEVDEYGRWVTLNYAPQVLDVLALRNGLERLMGNVTVPTRVRKVRFTLGSNTYLVDGVGKRFRPRLVNETDAFVYLRVKSADMDNSIIGNVDLRADFDLASSLEQENDDYILHPRLRLFNAQTTGGVTGNVYPVEVGARVMILDDLGFTTGAIPTIEEGYFRVVGLKPGTPFRMVISAPGYAPAEFRNVMVNAGEDYQLGDINLR
jgi:hypothetical protein